MIHVRCEEGTLESRRLIPCTLEGLQFVLDARRLGPSDPEYGQQLSRWFQLQDSRERHGDELSWVETAHRSAQEGNGGFVRASCCMEGVMDPYWREPNVERQDLDLLQTSAMGRCFRQASPVGILEDFRYTTEDNSVHATMCLQVYHFIGRKYDGEHDRMDSAVLKVQELVQGLLLRTRPTPQYLDAGNGLYKPNPDWGRYRRPQYDKVAGDHNLLQEIRQLGKQHEQT